MKHIKVASQVRRLPQSAGGYCLTGGLCECPYICDSLSQQLDAPVQTLSNARFAGAVGAAMFAMQL